MQNQGRNRGTPEAHRAFPTTVAKAIAHGTSADLADRSCQREFELFRVEGSSHHRELLLGNRQLSGNLCPLLHLCLCADGAEDLVGFGRRERVAERRGQEIPQVSRVILGLIDMTAPMRRRAGQVGSGAAFSPFADLSDHDLDDVAGALHQAKRATNAVTLLSRERDREVEMTRDPLSRSVPPTGIEPATFGTGNQRSIP